MADACLFVCLFYSHTYVAGPGGGVDVFLDPSCHFQTILLPPSPKSLQF